MHAYSIYTRFAYAQVEANRPANPLDEDVQRRVNPTPEPPMTRTTIGTRAASLYPIFALECNAVGWVSDYRVEVAGGHFPHDIAAVAVMEGDPLDYLAATHTSPLSL